MFTLSLKFAQVGAMKCYPEKPLVKSADAKTYGTIITLIFKFLFAKKYELLTKFQTCRHCSQNILVLTLTTVSE